MYCDSIKFNYDETGSFLLSIDSSPSDCGRLVWWSRAFEIIMDYSSEELKKMKIDSFMTESMAVNHTNSLNRYIDTGLSTKLYKNYLLPFINKSKYCEMVDMQIKPFVLFNPFKVTLISYGDVNGSVGTDYIVMSKYGFVETFTPGYAKILGKHINMGYQDKLPLIYFCPSLASFLLVNSTRFREQFSKIEEDKLPTFKKTVDKFGTETFIENFIWNSFDEKKLVQMSNALTEARFMEKKHDLYEFINNHVNSLSDTHTTSLITMRITKQAVSSPENVYFFVEFIHVKHYQDLVKSSNTLTKNPPLQWLLKLGSFEKQLDDRFQKSVVMQELKNLMAQKEEEAEISIHEELNEGSPEKLLKPQKDSTRKVNKLMQHAVQVTRMLKSIKPMKEEEYGQNVFQNSDFASENNSASLLINSEAGETEKEDIGDKKLHYKSTFLHPERQTVAKKHFFILKMILISRFILLIAFLICAFVLAITVS